MSTPRVWSKDRLLGALVFGDGLGSFGDSVLGEFTREDKAYGRLNLSGGHGLLLVVFAQSSCLARDPTKSVGHERVQDGHGSLGDSGVRVDLLEHAVDVDVVGFTVLSPVFLSGPTSSSSSWHLEFLVLS